MNFQDFIRSIVSPDLRAVAAHWTEVRAGRAMPAWEQLRPGEISTQLRLIWAYKYDPATAKFTGRLASERISRGFGMNFRGLPMEDAHPAEVLPRIDAIMQRIVREPTLYRNIGKLFKRGERIVEGERLILPLSSDGLVSDGVLGISDFKPVLWGDETAPVELLSDVETWSSLTAAAKSSAA
jgi:hypothetical protein